MGENFGLSAAARDYARARTVHCAERDLLTALHFCQRIVADHPGTSETVHAASQQRNIAAAVVPPGRPAAACSDPAPRESSSATTEVTRSS